MDLHLASPGPFTYLVGEHARAVVAIQELQREVNSLLAFRDHVLEALPHLHLREPSGAATPRPRPPSQTAGGKSLSEGPPTVADSGFSTDKASTSMGKSSSSSSGELSGGRWALGDPPEGGIPLGSTEDELWTLLEVIEKKGTRLRRDLERAEVRERELSHASDPTGREVSSPPPTEKWRGPGGDWWPHSLPGAGPRLDFVPGLEAWGEVERLRVDRMYLMGRLQRAEAEGGAAHQRLLDLHGQLLALAGEKRRLEDAFRAIKLGESFTVGSGGGAKGNKGVTVSIGGDASAAINKRSSSVRIGEDIFLPRVLKVPIKDKWSSKPPTKIPQGIGSSPTKGETPSPSKTIVLFPTSPKGSGNNNINNIPNPPVGALTSAGTVSDLPGASAMGGDRVVIERERNANRVDGGLSMPASLLKGARIKVRPDKQRISAILKEKDVLALQRQLLTTVMETEVLRRQLEMASEEWEARLKEWEAERHKQHELQGSLRVENSSVKKQLEHYRNIRRVDVGISVCPMIHSVGVGTSDEPETPTFSVHQGPNVKYDVVVFEENGGSSSSSSSSSKQTKAPPSVTTRKAQAPVEKPPRRTRPLSVGPIGDSPSFGRDSLGRIAKVPLKPSARTPPATPRSSPSPSMSVPRSTGGRIPIQDGPQSARGSPVTGGNGRASVGRRDSMKAAIGSSGPPVAKGGTSGGPHKSSPSLQPNANGNIRRHSQDKPERSCGFGRKRDEERELLQEESSHANQEDVQFESNNFFDSISEDVASSGYSQSYYSSNIQFLPPSPRLWTPIYGHTLSLHKGLSPNVSETRLPLHGGHLGSLLNDSLELTYTDVGALSSGSEERTTVPLQSYMYKGKRYKVAGGVLRLKKNQERPSVLTMQSRNSQVLLSEGQNTHIC